MSDNHRERSVAIVGGGISGLATAWYLEKGRQQGTPLTYRLFEATKRLGGILGTSHERGFAIESGADSWVNQKPWARELAAEIGLEHEFIPSLDQKPRTWILSNSRLVPLPSGMQLVVPADPAGALASELFSQETKDLIVQEQSLQPAAGDEPREDESVSNFVSRHFGREMVDKIAEPLLAGVFGGDASRLSAHAVLPNFVALERKHGSLIRGIRETGGGESSPKNPVFVSLRGGMQALPDALAARIPSENIWCDTTVSTIRGVESGWTLTTSYGEVHCDELVLAVSAQLAAKLLGDLDPDLGSLLDLRYSSCSVAALGFEPDQARRIHLPPGSGFLVPRAEGRFLMACTFVHQKFQSRAPAGCALLRAFIGEPGCHEIRERSDGDVACLVLKELQGILNFEAQPCTFRVQHWPHSMPQYEVGHLDRVARIEGRVRELGNVHLAGNGYRGVGIPDCIRSGKAVAQEILRSAQAMKPATMSS